MAWATRTSLVMPDGLKFDGIILIKINHWLTTYWSCMISWIRSSSWVLLTLLWKVFTDDIKIFIKLVYRMLDGVKQRCQSTVLFMYLLI